MRGDTLNDRHLTVGDDRVSEWDDAQIWLLGGFYTFIVQFAGGAPSVIRPFRNAESEVWALVGRACSL